MNSTFLTAVGLVLDIIGFIFLWKFGLPPDVRRGGKSFLLLEERDEDESKKATCYDRISRLSVFLIVMGFVFQLLGNFF